MEKYKPKKEKYVSGRESLSLNAKKFYEGRQMIIDAFKNKIFPMVPTGFEDDVDEDELLKRHERDSTLPTIKEKPEDEIPNISTLEQITELDKFYGSDLIYKYFLENSLIKIIRKLKDYKKSPEKLQMYNTLITRLNIGLERLENYINNMSEDEVENKKLDYLRHLVKKIVDASQKLDEKSAAQRQQGQGLKIITPKEMITRLPILLAQLKAGNNSQKLKNEIRQTMNSLYR